MSLVLQCLTIKRPPDVLSSVLKGPAPLVEVGLDKRGDEVVVHNESLMGSGTRVNHGVARRKKVVIELHE
jgi:hypothetical protein